MAIRTGSIVTHQYRKVAHFLIIVDNKGLHMVRVKKQAGYPIADRGRYLEKSTERMTEVDFVEAYANYTMDDVTRRPGFVPATNQFKKCLSHTELLPNVAERFADLAFRLEPESLTCDGELSRSQIEARRRAIMKEWFDLERNCGMTVSEDIVWQYVMAEREKMQQAATQELR